METYYKNSIIQTEEQVRGMISTMNDFVNPDHPRTVPIILDAVLTKIWNEGKNLDWKWSEESQQEIDQKEQQDQAEADKITSYKNDIVLWKNEKIRTIRNRLMSLWVDSIVDHTLLWTEFQEEKPGAAAELLEMRQTLKDWPATFTKYVTDQTIESKKPSKPSYIKV